MSHLLFEILSGKALDLKHRATSHQFGNFSPPASKLGLQKKRTQPSHVLNKTLKLNIHKC